MPVAIVTGGSSGIGLALVNAFLERGWNVVVADLNPPPESDQAASVLFVKTNVASWDSQAEMFAQAIAKFGKIDYVAANAGIDDKQLLYDDVPGPDDKPTRPNLITVEIDLIGVFYTVWLSLFYFRRNPTVKGGRIAITCSNAGIYPFPTNPQYATCKHAIVGLVRSTASVLKHENVTINCVCPAFVETNLAPKEIIAKMPKEHITPMSTIMRAFLAFQDDPSLTGQVAECSLGDIYYREVLPYANDSERWMFETNPLWDSAYGGN
ncbi:uncharacterized protein V1516DRAFT_664871 [Lipomyces oligophaga]|uniref:uncharacterized protein n=1 Tax=Lipomyces oligophaga TaxID=45792 RepID=UPI0034CD6E5D